MGEALRVRVNVVGFRGNAGGGEKFQGVVFVGGLLFQRKAHLGARHEPGH